MKTTLFKNQLNTDTEVYWKVSGFHTHEKQLPMLFPKWVSEIHGMKTSAEIFQYISSQIMLVVLDCRLLFYSPRERFSLG